MTYYKIMVSARLADDADGPAKAAIEAWCREYFGCVLLITTEKDFATAAIWGDRALQVEPNIGSSSI